MKPPLSHRFTIDGEDFCLVEYNHEEDRQIQIRYAQLIGQAPFVLDALFYDDLHAEAEAMVCLKEAPAWCWQTQPPEQAVNGAPTRVLDIRKSHRTFWPKLKKEIDVFRGLLRDAESDAAPDAPTPGAVPREPDAVAGAPAIPAPFRGQAV